MKAIVAVDQNWGIGKEGKLLAHIPEDLKYFKEKTLGHVVVMGRRTLCSLPGGKPLPGRDTVVLSRDEGFAPQGVTVVHSARELRELLREKHPGREVFLCGGGEVYREFLPECREVLVTKIGREFAADTFFPDLDAQSGWEREEGELRFHGEIPFRFCAYRRTGDTE
ncbi:dihydrofolate reductase [Christensenellaceae bacterium NSJ-63]|uniref:Dihydrofolate reductase n=1 Tax=Guopingia tenuis TaxID=2763656 RepID=A0A926DHF9_9FIRM|nr:dihydrofolate reductase [Guopingia tenuis]MBC8538246.1 dihydrofolate reductase [Guopingia tenuis]